HFGVTFHHDHVGRFLRNRLGWSPQKPRRRARERDETGIWLWRECTFPRIVRRAQDRNAHLVFLDESGFQLTPTVRRTWAPPGPAGAGSGGCTGGTAATRSRRSAA